jgi:hypothetical protein
MPDSDAEELGVDFLACLPNSGSPVRIKMLDGLHLTYDQLVSRLIRMEFEDDIFLTAVAIVCATGLYDSVVRMYKRRHVSIVDRLKVLDGLLLIEAIAAGPNQYTLGRGLQLSTRMGKAFEDKDP